MSRARLVVLQHVPHEGPGLIGELAAVRDAAVEVTRLDRGEPLPVLDDAAALVVMGGPMGVDDGDEHPYLEDERRLMAEAVWSGLPVLGVCLGAQQLARALGAPVWPGPRQEIGAGTVSLTEAARTDSLLGAAPSPLPCFHWHGDTFEPPEGAVRLAASDLYPNQAFRAGDRAWGLQFHVELDGGLADDWRPHLPEGVDMDEGDRRRIETAGRDIVGRFLDAAGIAA